MAEAFHRYIFHHRRLLCCVSLYVHLSTPIVLTPRYDARVPHVWTWTPGSDEFSWISSTLGLWFTSLLARDAQERSWLNEGRPHVFWLTGFKNPAGFLTSMTQEVTRQHKADAWALDDVLYQTVFTDHKDHENVRSSPKQGVFIHGLFCDGAAWSRSDGSLCESEPKVMFAAMPVLHVTGTTDALRQASIKQQAYGPYGPYECPCYKYPSRTGRFYIFTVDVASKEVGSNSARKPRFWILRGVALLCSTD